MGLGLVFAVGCPAEDAAVDTDASTEGPGASDGGTTATVGGTPGDSTDPAGTDPATTGPVTTEPVTTDPGEGGGNGCGNGIPEVGESCDGDNLAQQTCETLGLGSGELRCRADCTFDTRGCGDPVCGDGARNGREVCDGPDVGEATCRSEGFEGGVLGCTPDCSALDTSGCDDEGGGESGGGDGSCCTPSDDGSAGCGSPVCAAAVCAVDPFCCQEQWDGKCASAAAQLCDRCDTGDACGDGMVEGDEVCDGADIPDVACTDFGFGAGVLMCSGDCMQVVTTACTDLDGSCCEPNGTPGCEDADCVNAVCFEDPFCCEEEWDDACADAVPFACDLKCP